MNEFNLRKKGKKKKMKFSQFIPMQQLKGLYLLLNKIMRHLNQEIPFYFNLF